MLVLVVWPAEQKSRCFKSVHNFNLAPQHPLDSTQLFPSGDSTWYQLLLGRRRSSKQSQTKNVIEGLEWPGSDIIGRVIRSWWPVIFKTWLITRVLSQNRFEVVRNFDGKWLKPIQVEVNSAKIVWWKSAKRKCKYHIVPPLVIFHVCIRCGNKFSIPNKKMHHYYDLLATKSIE